MSKDIIHIQLVYSYKNFYSFKIIYKMNKPEYSNLLFLSQTSFSLTLLFLFILINSIKKEVVIAVCVITMVIMLQLVLNRKPE